MADRPNANAQIYEAIPQFGRLRRDVLFGDVWRQPELSLRDRSLVTCAMLAALGKNQELAAHVERAIDNGVTLDELRGMVVQVAFYAGWPCGVNAGKVLLPHLAAGGMTGDANAG
jgi:4-carboxymuconolactone decarboxylase